MKRIEVFIDERCNACITVVRMLRAYVEKSAATLTIYRRINDSQEFQRRKVAVTPTTFIDLKLAFYGEFSLQELQAQLVNKT